jgi:hypothetical protein
VRAPAFSAAALNLCPKSLGKLIFKKLTFS